jgi:hypothetical protein
MRSGKTSGSHAYGRAARWTHVERCHAGAVGQMNGEDVYAGQGTENRSEAAYTSFGADSPLLSMPGLMDERRRYRRASLPSRLDSSSAMLTVMTVEATDRHGEGWP